MCCCWLFFRAGKEGSVDDYAATLLRWWYRGSDSGADGSGGGGGGVGGGDGGR